MCIRDRVIVIDVFTMQEDRSKHLRRLNNWERLFCKVMGAKSHGRRWKFRIEPLKKKLEQEGYVPCRCCVVMTLMSKLYHLHVLCPLLRSYNPYMSDSSSDDSGEDEEDLNKQLEVRIVIYANMKSIDLIG